MSIMVVEVCWNLLIYSDFQAKMMFELLMVEQMMAYEGARVVQQRKTTIEPHFHFGYVLNGIGSSICE